MVAMRMLNRLDAVGWWQNNKEMFDDFLKRSKDKNCYDQTLEALYNQDAVLCVLYDIRTGEDLGFVVIVEQIDLFKELELYIWMTYCKVHMTRRDFFANYRELEKLARQVNAKRISFRTNRASAWSKRFEAEGFDKDETVTFTKVLDNVE